MTQDLTSVVVGAHTSGLYILCHVLRKAMPNDTIAPHNSLLTIVSEDGRQAGD